MIMWLGAGLALPYYGAEDFALHAIARAASSGAQFDLLGLVNAVRFGAAAAVTFAAGLALLGIAGVLLAISVWRTAILPRFSAVPLGGRTGSAVSAVLSPGLGSDRPWRSRCTRTVLAGLGSLEQLGTSCHVAIAVSFAEPSHAGVPVGEHR